MWQRNDTEQEKLLAPCLAIVNVFLFCLCLCQFVAHLFWYKCCQMKRHTLHEPNYNWHESNTEIVALVRNVQLLCVFLSIFLAITSTLWISNCLLSPTFITSYKFCDIHKFNWTFIQNRIQTWSTLCVMFVQKSHFHWFIRWNYENSTMSLLCFFPLFVRWLCNPYVRNIWHSSVIRLCFLSYTRIALISIVVSSWIIHSLFFNFCVHSLLLSLLIQNDNVLLTI